MRMNTPNKTEIKPSYEEIAARASQLWAKGGRQPGKDLEYWFQAENELLAARQLGAQGSFVSAPRTAMQARQNLKPKAVKVSAAGCGVSSEGWRLDELQKQIAGN